MTLFIIGFGCVGARDVSVVRWRDADLFRMRCAVGCVVHAAACVRAGGCAGVVE